jgi:Domain of unknown function (DUF4160)
MPILVRLRYCVIVMYFDDHNPPHFHIRGTDRREAQVSIETLTVMNGKVDPRAMTEALDWARGNRQLLKDTWHDFNS